MIALAAAVGSALIAATPTTPPDDTVSPGLAGFLTMFGLALATVLLVRSMVGHLRKVRYSAEPADSAPLRRDQGGPVGPGGPDAAGPSGVPPSA